jgi:hypothetical protein
VPPQRALVGERGRVVTGTAGQVGGLLSRRVSCLRFRPSGPFVLHVRDLTRAAGVASVDGPRERRRLIWNGEEDMAGGSFGRSRRERSRSLTQMNSSLTRRARQRRVMGCPRPEHVASLREVAKTIRKPQGSLTGTRRPPLVIPEGSSRASMSFESHRRSSPGAARRTRSRNLHVITAEATC